jgi:DNA-directed RNA polymerase subunit RPC12/RpoP
MNEVEVVLQANLCHSCGNVWFTPNFKSEGEQASCPYCKSTILKTRKHFDLTDESSIATIPPEIDELITRKTNQMMLERACVFCKNFIVVAKEDEASANSCPYCGDKLTQVNVGQEQNIQQQIYEGQTALDDMKLMPVLIKFKDTRSGIFKYISKPKKPLYGVYLGLCASSNMVRILDKDAVEVRWFDLNDIESITELIIANPNDAPPTN